MFRLDYRWDRKPITIMQNSTVSKLIIGHLKSLYIHFDAGHFSARVESLNSLEMSMQQIIIYSICASSRKSFVIHCTLYCSSVSFFADSSAEHIHQIHVHVM